MPFWNKADKLFTKVEKKGFDVANTLHRWTINGILLFCCYTVYGIGRDYNEQFREARVRIFYEVMRLLEIRSK